MKVQVQKNLQAKKLIQNKQNKKLMGDKSKYT